MLLLALLGFDNLLCVDCCVSCFGWCLDYNFVAYWCVLVAVWCFWFLCFVLLGVGCVTLLWLFIRGFCWFDCFCCFGLLDACLLVVGSFVGCWFMFSLDVLSCFGCALRLVCFTVWHLWLFYVLVCLLFPWWFCCFGFWLCFWFGWGLTGGFLLYLLLLAFDFGAFECVGLWFVLIVFVSLSFDYFYGDYWLLVL